MAANQVNPGANFEITVDGTTRSYRDQWLVALEAARYLKAKNPMVEVAVRNIRTGEVTSIQFSPPKLPAAPPGNRN